MESRVLKAAGFAGITTPFLVFACILGAIASWSKFSWVNNALSDLGVQWGLTATLFNAGLIVGGFLAMIFAVGLWFSLGKRLIGKVGVFLFFVACVSVIAIGIFNETFSPTHFIVSVMFFVFLPVSLLVLVGAFWIEGKRRLSFFTLALGLVAAAPWLMLVAVQYVPNVAIPEFISGLASAPWTIVLGYLMLKKGSKPKS